MNQEKNHINYFICDKPYSEIKVKNTLRQYCNFCDLHKTTNVNKEQYSYQSEFWEESDD